MKRVSLAAVMLGLVVGAGAGAGGALVYGDRAANGGDGAADERKILYWVAPMDPSYRRDTPGKSPMGMDLIPVYEGEDAADGEDDPSVVRISPAVENNIGVRTATVTRLDLSRDIATVGYVDYDETRLSHVHLRTDGWIERLHVRTIGERVEKGQILLELYSPTLVNAQAEYLQALRTGRDGLKTAALEKLRALEIDDAQITELRRSGRIKRLIQVRAPQDGIVTDLSVREGMYVKPAVTLMTLADLSSVWVQVDVFETQTSFVREGQTATMTLPYWPGREWRGTVEYVYPTVDPKTRTLKVRLRFDNPDMALKPNMYANVRLEADPIKQALAVPRQAVIRSGAQERVILALGDGRFKPRTVRTGMESGDRIRILDGLREGEKVVVSGQFLIDSESSIGASLQRLDAGTEEETAAETTQEPVEEAEGEGVVQGVMADHRMIALAHEPIAPLGWPAMKMNFTVADGVSLEGLEPGAAVRFTLRKDDAGSYRIVALQQAEG